MKTRWTPEAAAQLEAVLQYIAQRDPGAAARWLVKLEASLANVAAFPESGRVNPDHGDKFLREVIADQYRVIYLLQAKHIEVQSIWHGARRPPGRGLSGENNDE